MTVIFSKLIKCVHCGGGFKSKLERGKRRIYVCSRYDNFHECVRIPIEEDFLKDLINRRYGELSDSEMRDIVDHIVIRDKLLLEIHFKNDKPIIMSENFIQY